MNKIEIRRPVLPAAYPSSKEVTIVQVDYPSINVIGFWAFTSEFLEEDNNREVFSRGATALFKVKSKTNITHETK